MFEEFLHSPAPRFFLILFHLLVYLQRIIIENKKHVKKDGNSVQFTS